MLNEIDLSRADLNLLVLFEVVLAERHVARAARRLNLSPSAISHGLGRLRRLLNDPLFLRTPKGVVPTARADELAEPIADVLARARRIVATAAPFDPATSTRRFAIGAPDGTAILPTLLARIQAHAPGIDLGVRQILPAQRGVTTSAWEPALIELEQRLIDIAIVPLDAVPRRFAARTLYEEDFVIAMRARHPFAGTPTLAQFCRQRHLVVSLTGDPYGFVDVALERLGRSRRVTLTVPSFAMALPLIAESDLVAALPRGFLAAHARRFGLVGREVPLHLPRFHMRAIASKAALMDEGIAWLWAELGAATQLSAIQTPARGRGRS
jgi:DNA-binding transcriptional LysR family regulator